MQNKINIFLFSKIIFKNEWKYPKSFLKENKKCNACKTKIFNVLFFCFYVPKSFLEKT